MTPKQIGAGAGVSISVAGGGYAVSHAIKDNSLKVKEVLGAKWLLNVEDNEEINKEEYEELLAKLKSAKDKSEIKDQKLSDIFSSAEDDEKLWKELRTRCKEIYENKETKNLIEVAQKYCKKPTIKDKLKGTELDDSDDLKKEWESKVTEATKSSNTLSPDLQSSLSKITDSDNSKKQQALKDWCEEKYIEPFDAPKSSVSSAAKDLLEEVKKWCALTIKEKLTKPRDADGSDKNDEWKAKVRELKAYSGTTPPLTEELKKIKDENKNVNDDNGWVALKHWCKDTYEKNTREKVTIFIS